MRQRTFRRQEALARRAEGEAQRRRRRRADLPGMRRRIRQPDEALHAPPENRTRNYCGRARRQERQEVQPPLNRLAGTSRLYSLLNVLVVWPRVRVSETTPVCIRFRKSHV